MRWLPATGSLVILHNQAVVLLPQIYTGNALIVGGLKAEQQVWRTALLQAQLLTIVAEVLWTYVHPSALPQSAVGWALLSALALNALHLGTIFGLAPRELELEYTPELGVVLADGGPFQAAS